MPLKTYNEEQIAELLSKQPEGRYTKFFRQAHSLWTRFKNYSKNPPFVYFDKGREVALIYSTLSKKTGYTNLYEIFTLEGQSGRGYGSIIWAIWQTQMWASGAERMKLSCTPDSIGFHMKNGLVFWSVDKSGSLRSDQPIMQDVQKQKIFREKAITDPSIALPSQKVRDRLKKEDIENLDLSQKKLIQTYEAIQKTGDFWLRKHL